MTSVRQALDRKRSRILKEHRRHSVEVFGGYRNNRVNVPYFRPDIRQAEIDEVVATLKSGWLTTGPRVKRFEEEFRRRRGRPACRRRQLGDGRPPPGRGGAGPEGRAGRSRPDDDVRRDGGGGAVSGRRAGSRGLRSRDREPRPRRCVAKDRGSPGGPPLAEAPASARGRRDHPGPRRRADARHGRSLVVGEGPRPLGSRGRGARVSGGLSAVESLALAAVRREDVGRGLLLLLRQQDDHHGRGGDGRHGRSGRWRTGCG